MSNPPKPVEPTKNYYYKFLKDSKSEFLELISEKCKEKEDPSICLEKYETSFNTIFEILKLQLEKEDKLVYTFDRRFYYKMGASPMYRRDFIPQEK
jgi:hypothetical protein